MIPHGVSVTLVEPHGPVNVGHVARLVKNFGIEKLYLVNPQVDFAVAAMYASHASQVLDDAVVTTLGHVRREHELLVATTAVRAKKKSNIKRRIVNPERLHDLLSSSGTSSLVFGRDTTGLTNREIEMCDATTTIDAVSGHRALNIGHAAAILLYLSSRPGKRARPLQTRKAREVFARSLSDLGAASKTPGHKARTLFEVGKRIATSSELGDAQLHLMSGVFRKAVQSLKEYQDADSKT